MAINRAGSNVNTTMNTVVRGNGQSNYSESINGKTTTLTGSAAAEKNKSLLAELQSVLGKGGASTAGTGSSSGLPGLGDIQGKVKEALAAALKKAGVPEEAIKSALAGFDKSSSASSSSVDNSKDSFDCGTTGQSASSKGSSAASEASDVDGADAASEADEADGVDAAAETDEADETDEASRSGGADPGAKMEALLKKLGVGEAQAKEILAALNGGKAKGAGDSSSFQKSYAQDSFSST